MPIIGVFQIQDKFNLTGRGPVILGQVLEGTVKIGAALKFEIGDDILLLQITAVEMADNISEKKFGVGVMFAYKDEQQKNHVRDIKIKEQLAEIIG